MIIHANSNYDIALQLKIDYDSGNKLSEEKALKELAKSALVTELTTELINKPMFYIWRLIALSEIPYTKYLDYTKILIDKIYKTLSTPFGFSLNGNESGFLPCYNAMLATALCRLDRGKDDNVIQAIEWIDKYQPMERGRVVDLPKFNFNRHGGCFNNTPCYINIVKATTTLSEYQRIVGDNRFCHKKQQGLKYILQHQLFKRLNSDEPINQHILDIAFPESYHVNIVELIRLISNENFINDNRVSKAKNYLLNIKQDGGWRVTYRYKAPGYMVFDKGRTPAHWVNYIINKALPK